MILSCYLKRYDALKQKQQTIEVATPIPKVGRAVNCNDEVLIYGLRATDPRLKFLSPWEFTQKWGVHKLRPPSAHYHISKWAPSCQRDDREGGLLVAGVDYILNDAMVAAHTEYWIPYPDRSKLKDSDVRTQCQQLRNSVLLFSRSRPVVPCPEQTPLPNRHLSKQKRSKIFSVYLRPWTLIKSEASADVPYLADLDVCIEDFPAAEDCEARNIRAAWTRVQIRENIHRNTQSLYFENEEQK